MSGPHDNSTVPAGESAARGTVTRILDLGRSDGTPHLGPDDTTRDYPTIPGYRIDGVLGRGGMGVVYDAVELRLQRPVALKVLRPAYDDSPVGERFEDEATILAQFDHRNIVPVFAAGRVGRWRYCSMKRLPRGPLSKHLEAFRGDAATAVRLMAKVARAVQYLHDNGVWHRDLKPHNVLLDDDGEPLVADFGVAKWVSRDAEAGDHTVGGVRLGTYAYMSPEMISFGSARCGPAADVWALGVMLYELLAGERPFPGDNGDPSLPKRIVEDAPRPFATVSTLTPGTDDRLERIALTALAKDTAHRYPTAGALAADLDRWLADAAPSVAELPQARQYATKPDPETVVAPPPRRRRNSAWLVAGGMIALLALCVAAGFALFPKRTVLEEFEKAGEVIVVEGDGTRRHELSKLDGSRGDLEHDAKKGWLVVPGTSLALYEIAAAAPEPPYRLSAKVYHDWGDVGSYAGLYVRRVASPNGNGSQHQLYALALDTALMLNGRRGAYAHGAIRLDLDRQQGDGYVFPRLFERTATRHAANQPEFRDLALEVHADRVVAVAESIPFEPIQWSVAECALDLNRLINPNAAVGPPVLGTGFGLFAFRGAAAFRDVRVTRIP